MNSNQKGAVTGFYDHRTHCWLECEPTDELGTASWDACYKMVRTPAGFDFPRTVPEQQFHPAWGIEEPQPLLPTIPDWRLQLA